VATVAELVSEVMLELDHVFEAARPPSNRARSAGEGHGDNPHLPNLMQRAGSASATVSARLVGTPPRYGHASHAGDPWQHVAGT
jgi:hypothetical protein